MISSCSEGEANVSILFLGSRFGVGFGEKRSSFHGLHKARELYSLWLAGRKRCSSDYGCLVGEKGAGVR